MKNEKGFTLIEIMIVLFVITILLLISLPNVSSHYKNIEDKGCEGLVKMIQSQVTAYWLDEKAYPETINDLQEKGYLEKDVDYQCPGGDVIIIEEGIVKSKKGS